MMRTHLLRAAGFLAALGTAATAIVVLFGHVTNGSHASAAPSTGATDGDPAAISAAEAAQMGFTPASVHQRGRFTGASGRAFGLYVGKRSDTGKECVILAGAGGTGAACDATLFTNGPVSFVEAFRVALPRATAPISRSRESSRPMLHAWTLSIRSTA
jgi:hypothetical protein